jgi:hypothetical protein
VSRAGRAWPVGRSQTSPSLRRRVSWAVGRGPGRLLRYRRPIVRNALCPVRIVGHSRRQAFYPGARRREPCIRSRRKGPGVLGVRNPDAVSRLENAEFDPLATEGDHTLGPDVEADGVAGHEHFQFTGDGIDPADDTVGLEYRSSSVLDLHAKGLEG